MKNLQKRGIGTILFLGINLYLCKELYVDNIFILMYVLSRLGWTISYILDWVNKKPLIWTIGIRVWLFYPEIHLIKNLKSEVQRRAQQRATSTKQFNKKD